jgi:predicted aldo/keto reductase-like oxidoreductase
MTGMAGLGTLATPTAGPQAEDVQELKVPTRPFGRSGSRVSILSLGGMFDTGGNLLMLQQALRWGVTYWDTADCYQYGKYGSEGGMGRFFEKFPQARQQVFLVSKSDARDPAGMSRLLDQSLSRLRTDRIDLYFVHGIRRIEELNEDTRRWAEQRKAEGKIRLFGFSTHRNMEDCLLAASELGWIDGIMMTYNYRLMHQDGMRRAVDACVEAGIGLTAMKTQGGGSVRADSETELEMAGRFLQKGYTDAQAKLKAVWANPRIASICSQMPNMSILMANVAAAQDKTELSQTDTDLLQKYAGETAASYCTGCTDICEKALGETVPIGRIMRALMYLRSYGDRSLALETFQRIPEADRQRLERIDYAAAARRCPQRIDIARRVKEALEQFA